VWIRKGKLCDRTFKVYQVQDKPTLNNIFKSYLGCCDLESLCNSFDYFERQWKKVFVMIWQLALPMFFVNLKSTKRWWDPFIKVLHTLHASKLNLSNNIEDLQFVHIVKLIQIDLVTCARYYDHKTFYFCKLITKYHYLFGYIYINIYILSLNSKIMGVNMIMDFIG